MTWSYDKSEENFLALSELKNVELRELFCIFINIKLDTIIFFKVVKNTQPQQSTFTCLSLTLHIDEDSSNFLHSIMSTTFSPHIAH